MIRALLIAPYQRLATAFEAVAAGHDQVKVDSFVGNLDDALVYFNHYFITATMTSLSHEAAPQS